MFQCANVGPAEYNYDETISTLRYANRAKNIRNRARINEDPKDALLRMCQKEIEELRKQLHDGGTVFDIFIQNISVNFDIIFLIKIFGKTREIMHESIMNCVCRLNCVFD